MQVNRMCTLRTGRTPDTEGAPATPVVIRTRTKVVVEELTVDCKMPTVEVTDPREEVLTVEPVLMEPEAQEAAVVTAVTRPRVMVTHTHQVVEHLQYHHRRHHPPTRLLVEAAVAVAQLISESEVHLLVTIPTTIQVALMAIITAELQIQRDTVLVLDLAVTVVLMVAEVDYTVLEAMVEA